jgi:hypothetical protein
MDQVKKSSVRIVSWLGGEHWYIDNVEFLRLEEAMGYCDRRGLRYEIAEPEYMHTTDEA